MREEVRVLVFDMDGTIANLYGVPNWLEMLRAESTTPYEIAEPMYNMNELAEVLHELQKQDITIAVTTWTSKGGSREYNKQVRAAKIAWLEKYNFPYNVFHCQAYGTTKANATRKFGGNQILFDDNEKIRKGWHLGRAIDANFDIMGELYNLLCE